MEVAFFWQLVCHFQPHPNQCLLTLDSQKVYRWATTKTSQQQLFEHLADARVYEEWEAAAINLDEVLTNDFWRNTPSSKKFNYKDIHARTVRAVKALEEDDISTMIDIMREPLARRVGNVTLPELYTKAYAGTKMLIEDYVMQTAMVVEYVSQYPTETEWTTGLSNQAKLDLFHDTRQAYGRSCLVLQGGSIFGLCHIGVVRALYLHDLLPRIIAGTATGALMAALVGVHTQEELRKFLDGGGIDLTAFVAKAERDAVAAQAKHGHPHGPGWLSTLVRRVQRFLKYGYLLDVNVLEQSVRTNVGDMTFEEAYQHTKRVLNITISTKGGGVPNLLNYLTAPNVLIWSAAMASNATDARHSPVSLMCKNASGEVVPWDIQPHPSSFAPSKTRYQAHSTDHDRDTPLSRVSELFNVNHFIVSQARPYVAPFLEPSLHHPNSKRSRRDTWGTHIMRIMIMEIQHRLKQLDSLGFLPPGIRRLLLDENIPAESLTLVPKVTLSDFLRLLRNPSRQEIDHWILRGERSVWPAVTALKIRCAIELELDRGYQLVRRKKPFDLTPAAPDQMRKIAGEKRKRKKLRSSSMTASIETRPATLPNGAA